MSKPTTGRPRLSDVAREAGVSLGAASKALSQPDAVRQRTLTTVRRAVEKLGYIPSDSARALASRSTRLIGIVLPTINNPVFAAFVHVLQKELAASDYQLLALAHEYDLAVEGTFVKRLIRRGVDGLILIGHDHDQTTIDMLEKVALPYLLTWSTDESVKRGLVGFSNRRAMHAVIDHLAALGHRSLGVLIGETAHSERARWRLIGIEEAAEANGMAITAVETVPLSIDGGRAGFHHLAPLSKGITALVCATDIVAAGALDAAKKSGVDVPRQLSITGFDDVDFAQLLTPALTTVHIPISDMATHVSATILAIIAHMPVPDMIELPTSLVPRESTAPALSPS